MTEVGGLRVEGLTVRYGGNVAVNDISFVAPRGRITGLIGPNGAGKSTTFAGCTGLVRPAAGRVLLDDRDITALPVHRRAQLGIGRTFQRMELFESLSVRDNVALGREAALAGSRPWAHIRARKAEATEIADAVGEALALCSIQDLAAAAVQSLSTGQRRLVELARAAAGRATMLLLDEPSSGLDHSETERFGETLRHLVSERGVGILLVEHDMSLVMTVCEHLYVLDFGVLICEGTPESVQRDDAVRRAYLGSAA